MTQTLVFKPHPLWSRTTPKTEGGFGVAPLFKAAPNRFRSDAPLTGPALALEGPQDSALANAFEGDGAPGAEAGPVQDRPHGVAQGPVDLSAPPAVESDWGSPMVHGEPGAAAGSGAGAGAVVAAGAGALDGAALEALLAARYREGFEDGLQQAAQLPQDDLALMQSLREAVERLTQGEGAAARFEPLKRLALHLAGEMVRAQWNEAPQWVEGLVLRCVQALESSDGAVVVELNPQDLALLRQRLMPMGDEGPAAAEGAEPWWSRVQWREDESLARGSVRARGNDALVEDLIENRLASMVRDLQIDAPRWQRAQVALDAGRAADLKDDHA